MSANEGGVFMGVWAHDARRAALGVALAGLTVIGVAGCTSEQATPGTTLAPVSSSIDPSRPAPSDAPSSAAVSTRSLTSEAPPSPPAVSSSAPALILTPEQQQWADRAVPLLQQTWEVKDAVLADPGRDWTAEIRRVMGDPAASSRLVPLNQWPNLSCGGSETTKVEIAVASAQGTGEPGTTILLSTCVDSSTEDLVDRDGNSVQAPLKRDKGSGSTPLQPSTPPTNSPYLRLRLT